jgi:hypothetical protein
MSPDMMLVKLICAFLATCNGGLVALYGSKENMAGTVMINFMSAILFGVLAAMLK